MVSSSCDVDMGCKRCESACPTDFLSVHVYLGPSSSVVDIKVLGCSEVLSSISCLDLYTCIYSKTTEKQWGIGFCEHRWWVFVSFSCARLWFWKTLCCSFCLCVDMDTWHGNGSRVFEVTYIHCSLQLYTNCLPHYTLTLPGSWFVLFSPSFVFVATWELESVVMLSFDNSGVFCEDIATQNGSSR
jgi:hypothetical protein